MATSVNFSAQQTTNLATLVTATGLTSDQIMDIALQLFHREYIRSSGVQSQISAVIYTDRTGARYHN